MDLRIFTHERDSGLRSPAAANMLKGARYSGQLTELFPQVLVGKRAVATITGRANILVSLVDVPATVAGISALWLWSGHGDPYPLHVYKTRVSRQREHMFHVGGGCPIDDPVVISDTLAVTTRAETLYDLARTIKREKEFLDLGRRLLTSPSIIVQAQALWADNAGKKGNTLIPHRLQLLSALAG